MSTPTIATGQQSLEARTRLLTKQTARSRARDDAGRVSHTCSVYGRGPGNVMTACDLLDRVPKGGDEGGGGMGRLRRRDEYDADA